MSEQYTPGPWAADGGGDGELEIWAPESGSKVAICVVANDFSAEGLLESSTRPDVCDNARLIAAAPELLEALEQVTELFQWSESGSAEERAYDVARAAIAKAKAGKIQNREDE